ncbi:MAG: hypothetical protein DRP62_06025 [Planctomycetota bacterium]|nr:MAG: hypothetical protein DRP62_06025 [Planctomycetota bacterium]
MHIKNKDVIYIAILSFVVLCVGVYLISTTVLIAKDGVTFIEYAQNLESTPVKTIRDGYQHPGYPLLILTAHRIAEIVCANSSLWSWIYSAQFVALIFRLLAVVALYFIGKEITGAQFSFLAVLILIFLPGPAKLGSDALSDWPHIFFLTTGLLLLIRGAMDGKWWLFGFAGLAGGMGYLIRPECAQVIVYGVLWLGLQVFWSQRTMSRAKAVFALALLLVGFLVMAGPYMKLKGAIFPKKQLVQFVPKTQSSEVYEQEIQIYSNGVYAAGFAPSALAGALGKLVQRVSETLMWFFIPALLIGMYNYFRKRDWLEPERVFIIALVALNVLIMVWLYCKFGYMSRRHTLPLVVFTIFYIPSGLQTLGFWLEDKFSRETQRTPATKGNKQFWFLLLLIIGISICIPKLLTPIRAKKQSYRDAAQWLAKNTGENDIIAASDGRIGFYADRKCVEYDGQTIPRQAEYIVKVVKRRKDMLSGVDGLEMEKVIEGKSKVVIYRLRHRGGDV